MNEKFWSQVTVTGFCWYWGGKTTDEGYGYCWLRDSATNSVHRIAYEMLVGLIPTGMQLDHLCRTRSCVNPDHLEVVGAAEHAVRSNLYRTTRGSCSNGHPRTLEDSLALGEDYYRCRQCILVRTHRRRGRDCSYDDFCDAPSHAAPMKARRALGTAVLERDETFGVFQAGVAA